MKGMNLMKNKKEFYICLMILGIILLCAGTLFSYEDIDYAMSPRYYFQSYFVPFLSIVIGAAFIIYSATRLAMIRMVLKHPGTVRQIEVDAKDERQKHINHMARSRAFTAMEIVYAALALTFILMKTPPIILLLLAGGYMAGWLIYFIYLRKLAKKM